MATDEHVMLGGSTHTTPCGVQQGLTSPCLSKKAIGANTDIRTLSYCDLRLFPLVEPGAAALAQALRGNSVLEQLNLTGNSLGNAGVIALAGSLVGSSRGFLLTLWLSRYDDAKAGFVL